MAAIKSLIAREAVHQLSKRKNWAAKNVGPMVVFCIVGVVGIFLTWLFFHKKMAARKEARQSVV